MAEWSYVSPKPGQKCAGKCNEPLRGAVVTLYKYPGTWHMHCALTQALDPAPAEAIPPTWNFFGGVPVRMTP